MLRIRTAALATGFTALTMLGGAAGATAGTGDISGASASVSPSAVPLGGSFTLTVDCSAYADPSPGEGGGQGLAGPVTLSPVGGGKYQGTGRLATDLGGETSVGISGTCAGRLGQWHTSVRVTPTTSPSPTSTVMPTATPSLGVQGGVGSTVGSRVTTRDIAVGSGLTVAALGATGFILYRRRRSSR